MNSRLPTATIVELTGCDSVELVESVQSLWSGYGEILRIRLISGKESTPAIVKYICPPARPDHKYGWGSSLSHQRKLLSYENEVNWYQGPRQFCCRNRCRVPQLIATVDGSEHEFSQILILEDLDAAGFDLRLQSVNEAQIEACLSWLAYFHALFFVDREAPEVVEPAVEYGLWPTGTYWHLQTRPEELKTMEAGPLKSAAPDIDAVLNGARFQTLVHGDAKLANFCFSSTDQVAAVDFQYVGGGCGIKDVAYFISSCLTESECQTREQDLLKIYFTHLEQALALRPENKTPFKWVEREWRQLYPFAWADFLRFLAGWSPGHWKIHRYSQSLTNQVLSQLSHGKHGPLGQ